VPPHIFAIAECAYRRMITGKVMGRQLNYIMHEADRTAIKKITRTHIQAVKTLNGLAIASKINRYVLKEMQCNERYAKSASFVQKL
jgi:hypothetical protein